MNSYVIYNLILGAVLIPISLALLPPPHRWRHVGLAARIGVLIALFGFPWDFFAIRLGAWTYPTDPGLTLYGVPANDLVLMWICSYFTTAVLISSNTRNGSDKGHAEGKDTGKQNA